MNNLEKLRQIVTDILGREPGDFNGQTHLRDDLMFDGLDDVDLEITIEIEFNIEVPAGAPDAWLTVADVDKFVTQALIDRDLQNAIDADPRPELRVV